MRIASIFKGLEYKNDKPAVSVLLESDFTKELRIAFKEGQLMKDYKTLYPIVVQIVEGAIDFGVGVEDYNFVKGDLIYLKANIPHNLKARQASIVQ